VTTASRPQTSRCAPPGDEIREYFAWHLRIISRLATPAGFELGSGMSINTTLPEETADLLRRAVQHGGFT
jgi:UDPglucose--hexose-1-phosphate uridylyltransferase